MSKHAGKRRRAAAGCGASPWQLLAPSCSARNYVDTRTHTSSRAMGCCPKLARETSLRKCGRMMEAPWLRPFDAIDRACWA